MIKLNLDDWLTRIESAHPVSWDLGLERVGRVGRTLDLIHPERVVLLPAQMVRDLPVSICPTWEGWQD